MSTPTMIKSRHLKGRKCPECDEPLRLCQKGIVCKKNHIFDKESGTWLDIMALVTGIPRCAVIPVVEAGFMMSESSGRASYDTREESDSESS